MAEDKKNTKKSVNETDDLNLELPFEGGTNAPKKRVARKKVAKKKVANKIAKKKVVRKKVAKKKVVKAAEKEAPKSPEPEVVTIEEKAPVPAKEPEKADVKPKTRGSRKKPKVETDKAAPVPVEVKADSADAAVERKPEKDSADSGRERMPRPRGRRSRKVEPNAESSEEVKSEKSDKGRDNKSDAETTQAPQAKAKREPKPEPEPDPGPPAPELINLNEFQQKPVSELYELGASMGLRVGGIRSKHQLIFEILAHWGRKGTKVEAEGVLETGASDHFGFLRWPQYSFMPFQEDIYVGKELIRNLGLKKGHLVKGIAHPPRDREKFITMDTVISIEGIPADKWQQPRPFDELTAISPRERLILEGSDAVSARVVDIIAPLGKGQRGIIVAPPRGGKTIMLKDIAKAITANHSEVEVIILLLDERPEEVTDFEESVDATVYSSTFDEAPERHIQVAELVAERAKRLVELKRDVVILMDSLTRLARGYNGVTKGGGRTGSGGMDTKALPKSRKIFNIARNVEEGGSLTMLATALVDTGARMDQVIFEEFKGSGNMEIELDRELLEMRIFPAINIPKSGTRKDDLLYHPDELRRINMIRRQLAARPGGEAMEVLVRNIRSTKSNAELLMRGSLD